MAVVLLRHAPGTERLMGLLGPLSRYTDEVSFPSRRKAMARRQLQRFAIADDQIQKVLPVTGCDEGKGAAQKLASHRVSKAVQVQGATSRNPAASRLSGADWRNAKVKKLAKSALCPQEAACPR